MVDVTVADFSRHVATSVILMGLGLGLVAFVRFRYDTGHQALMRMTIALVVATAAVAGLSLISNLREIPCADDPNTICYYNDGVPAIGVLVGVYVIVALFAARVLYVER